jgi:trans-aconitate methyltransferase
MTGALLLDQAIAILARPPSISQFPPMDDVTSLVARQYEAYLYPPPIRDLVAAKAAGEGDYGDPALLAPLFWPEGRSEKGLEILVAGCGAHQAAMLAFNNPEANVTGIDLSGASLAHHRYLREKHSLANLTLLQGDLREVRSIGRTFDLVVSSGVLHHLADPAEGLAALRAVLKADGAMALMVYGATGRTGIYMLQDVFRRLKLDQSEASAGTVRQVIANLPDNHIAKHYLAGASELKHDTAIVDTFLHRQDRAFTVPQLLEWIEGAGLHFQAWTQNQYYYPDALVREPARSLIQRLPEPDQWACVENLLCVTGTHGFVVRHAKRAVAVDFDGPDWMRWRPRLVPTASVAGDGSTVVLQVDNARFVLTPAEQALVQGINGRATIGEIINHRNFSQFAKPEVEAFARQAFGRFRKIGAAMFQK